MRCEVGKHRGRKVGLKVCMHDKYKDDGMTVGDVGVVNLALD